MIKYNVLLVATFTISMSLYANSASSNNKPKNLDETVLVLQQEQNRMDRNFKWLADKQKESEHELEVLISVSNNQSKALDSLRKACKRLGEKQSTDNKNICSKIEKTNSNVQENQDTLQSRTLWIGAVVFFLLAVIIGMAYRLTKRIKHGDTSIDEVRKVQEALQTAQTKMQEESVKLDDKLLELLDKQLANTPKEKGNDTPDHSLALKVADEIARIELNMSRMDSSVRGYKQLSKAVERIKDNFKANGYEIVDMLGKPYNEGMKVVANFVVDEDLDEGAQVITGITKPQVNYNGQMIQAAQITVSQNI